MFFNEVYGIPKSISQLLKRTIFSRNKDRNETFKNFKVFYLNSFLLYV